MCKWGTWGGFVLVLVLVSRTSAAGQGAPQRCDVLPANLQVADMYRPLVLDLFARSAPRERQCLTLAAATHVQVVLVSPVRLFGHCRARATFLRDSSGQLRVLIEVPGGIDYPELLAHELEHVLEQIEGLDLPEMARLRRTGVRQVGAEVYETARAQGAGRKAARELAAGLAPGNMGLLARVTEAGVR
jgi:hypothetical protein